MYRLGAISAQPIRISSLCCRCWSCPRPATPTAIRTITSATRHLGSMGIVDELEAQWSNSNSHGLASSSTIQQHQVHSRGSTLPVSPVGADQRRYIASAAKAKADTKTNAKTAKTAKTKSPSHKSKSYISILTSIRDQFQGTNANQSLPDLSAYPLVALQEEVRFWGYRSSSSRDKLDKILADVWTSLTRNLTPSSSSSSVSSSPPSSASPESTPSSSPATPEPIQDTFAHTLQTTITSDQELYDRILLYEPIPFEEVWSVLKRKQPGMFSATSKGKAQVQVKAWLDLQGIVWYEGDFGGTGSRW